MPKRSKYNIFGTLQGVFHPQALNSEGVRKYIGTRPPIFRSSYERNCFLLLEKHPGVKSWSSETTTVPYISPLDQRKHTYFVDLTFTAMAEDGSLETFIVEVKPYSQTIPPVKKPRQRLDTFNTQAKTWVINVAKWNAAYAFAKKHGYKFYIWHEQGITYWEPNNKIK